MAEVLSLNLDLWYQQCKLLISVHIVDLLFLLTSPTSSCWLSRPYLRSRIECEQSRRPGTARGQVRNECTEMVMTAVLRVMICHDYEVNQIHPCMGSYPGGIERTNSSSISLSWKQWPCHVCNLLVLFLQRPDAPSCRSCRNIDLNLSWRNAEHSAAREPLLSSRVVGSDPGQHDSAVGCP